MPFQSARGFKDALPSDSGAAVSLESAARRTLANFGFSEIRLPTVEFHELFVKSTGETTDIVEKEMFVFEDSGGRKLALRPEGTPGVVRAYLQHHMCRQGGRTKLFYVGSMFRAERPQAGRLREFEQIGAECFGNPHPAADAELIMALSFILDEAGLKRTYTIHVNNLGCEENACRPAFRSTLLSYLEKHRGDLCEHCKARLSKNPLRTLDCKGDAPRLRELPDLPSLSACPACRDHEEELSCLLETGSIQFNRDASLVRGLDYYTRTVFEFKSRSLGSQDALAGGGRYDGLVQSMGGAPTPAVGWALGVERVLLAASQIKPAQAPALHDFSLKPVYVALQADSPAVRHDAMRLLHQLRLRGIPSEGGLFGHSLKSQMREADRLKARWVVIYGDREFQAGTCILKDMTSKDAQQAIPLKTAHDVIIERSRASTTP